MGLKNYTTKRNFTDTPEPKGSPKSAGKQLRFVVQKHNASRLHYDFRLEMEGVLKSWAVPKGPSLNPDDKRLAVMVEDHPYDYRTFKGVIPAGNYGAGTVEIFDEGTYLPLEKINGKKNETVLLSQLKKGDLKFILNGKKLKGAFALVRMHDDSGNNWLLIKKKDDHAVSKMYTIEKIEPLKPLSASVKTKFEKEKKAGKRTTPAKKTSTVSKKNESKEVNSLSQKKNSGRQ